MGGGGRPASVPFRSVRCSFLVRFGSARPVFRSVLFGTTVRFRSGGSVFRSVPLVRFSSVLLCKRLVYKYVTLILRLGL